MNESRIFQVPGEIVKIETLSRCLRLRIDTQENVSADALKRLIELRNQVGWFTFSIRQIEATDIVDLPPIKKKDDGIKSKAQIMRGVLFRIWEKDNEGMEDFELYYDVKMDKFINHLKEKYLA